MTSKSLAILLLLAGCRSSTDSGQTAIDVKGVWAYNGVQTSPALSVQGVLHITQQSASDFSGSAELSETDVQGTVRTRTGPLNGRIIGGNGVDFDIFIENVSRRHVAEVKADSMAGSWARTGVIPPVTGTFSARKTR